MLKSYTLLHGEHNETLEFDTLADRDLAASIEWAMERSTIGIAGVADRFFGDGDLILAQRLGSDEFVWLWIGLEPAHTEVESDVADYSNHGPAKLYVHELPDRWHCVELAGPPCDTVSEIAAQLDLDHGCAQCGTEDTGRFSADSRYCDDCLDHAMSVIDDDNLPF